MSKSKLLLCGVLVFAVVMVTANSVQAYPVDLFTGLEVTTVIDYIDPNPTLLKAANGDILGGERDLLLEVLGQPGRVSYSGTIGQKKFVFNSESPGVTATLQYDGFDADVAGPVASLDNAEGLGGIDLTAGGTVDGFKLDFDSIDGGHYSSTDIEIEIHNGTDVAQFVGTISDSSIPIRYDALFSNFTGATSALSSATSVEIRFNTNGNPDVDFIMTGSVGVPEPATVGMLAFGGILVLWRKRRKAA